jgi:uncharacterized membrane protein
MTVKFKNELLLIDILVILLIIIITFFQSSVLRVILGLPFLLFFPGYMLIATLFPRRDALDSIERVALSFALSIAVVAGIGFILNFTLWGITLYPVLISLSIFILVTSVIAWVRRRLADEEYAVTFTLSLHRWRAQNRVGRILSVILVAVIVGAIGILGFAIATPKEEGSFTEFYVLGDEGKAEDYPKELTLGETATVIVGIMNHEDEAVSYRVEILIDGEKNDEISKIVLGQKEKWEQEVFFTPDKVGGEQEVEFVLYKDDETYRRLQLWVNVNEQE